jgi:tetratricopeptide (TPR) repeat protein
MTPSRPLKASVLWPAAVIGLLGAWIYWPALRGGWVWDDVFEIPQNAVLRDPGGLARIWAGTAGPDYFPLKTSLQWILWRAWGPSPAGFHALSLGLQLLSALLFWRLLRKLGVRGAWLGGLLFTVHPLVVESVAWIAELKNTLSLALLLGAMIAYVDYDQGAAGARRRSYALALLGFLLALLSKSSVVMFPFVILLYCWWRRGRIGRRDLVAALPFFGLSLLLGSVTIFFQYHRALAVWTIPVGGAASHLALAGTALAFYLGKAVLPFGLHPMYRPWSVNPPGLAQALPWLGLLTLLGWLWRRRLGWGRHALFGLGFFVLNLVPVLGFLPMSYLHISWVADHFAYLPLLGLIGLGVGAAGAVWHRLPAGKSGPRTGLICGGALIVLACAWESRGYASAFRSDQDLWARTLEANPQAWMARIDLGKDLFQQGRLEEAVAQYDQALAIRADLPEAYYNRGSTFLRLGRLPEAVADLQAALLLQPASPDAQTNLGNALARSGRVGEAIPHYEEALRIQPDAADARANLIRALLLSVPAQAQAREWGKASAACAEVLRLDSLNIEARADLGNILLIQGQFAAAIAQYETVLRLKPGDPGTEANLNLARRRLRQEAP